MFCPSCHAEYRAGFETCAHCKVTLVASLEVAAISPDEVQNTLQVGLVPEGESTQTQEIGDKVYDLTRVFPVDLALLLRDMLTNDGVPVLIVPVDEIFPDQRTHYEVRVKAGDHVKAEGMLQAWWTTQVETQRAAAKGAAEDFEHCPACNAHVPLDAEECPDCGLFVGAGAPQDEDGEADSEDDEA